jgi:tRNA threonylcarbamoyladenosine biosynthesis protein TsaE
MSSGLAIFLPDAEATEAFGARLAGCCREGTLVFLHGELGAGKTTLVRGFLRAAGCSGPVKSPTYTLIEPYSLERGNVYHLDLYRLADAEELEWIGVRDLFDGEQVCLIEWPERGAGFLPEADLHLYLRPEGSGRRLHLAAETPRGQRLVDCLD